jgi:hypothetical protein
MIKGAPEWAVVKVWKKGEAEPTVAQAWWDEYAPADLTKAPFWVKMPRRMLAKCATALALRQAYPDLGGMYIPEELERMGEDYTPEGRQIVQGDTAAVAGRAAAQAVAQEKIAAHASKTANRAPEPPVQETSAVPKANLPPKAPIDLAPTHTVTSNLPDNEAKGTIEVDWTADRKSPIVRGDIAEILPIMQKYCKLVWREDWWHCEITDVETLRQMAEQFSYKFVQILPNDPPPPPKQKRTSSAAPKEQAEERPAPAGEKKERPKAAEPVLVKGVIENHVEKMTRKNQPMMSVLLKTDKGKVWYSVFDNDLFPFISKAKGREGEFFTTEGNYPTIKGFKTLAGKEFTDGKVPVIQRSAQEAGQRTLY